MKLIKRTIVTFLTLTLLLGYAPSYTAEVQAAPKVEKSYTVYPFRWPCDISITVDGLGRSQKIERSTVKIAKDKYIKLSKISYADWDGSKHAILRFTIKRPTISTISFKIGKKRYQTRLQARRYSNPVKNMVIPGIMQNGKKKADLASMTRDFDTSGGTLERTIKNAKIEIRAASGWKIKRVCSYMMYSPNAVGNVRSEYGHIDKKYKKGLSKATVKIRELRKDCNYTIYVDFLNIKTGDTFRIRYYINGWDDSPHDTASLVH